MGSLYQGFLAYWQLLTLLVCKDKMIFRTGFVCLMVLLVVSGLPQRPFGYGRPLRGYNSYGSSRPILGASRPFSSSLFNNPFRGASRPILASTYGTSQVYRPSFSSGGGARPHTTKFFPGGATVDYYKRK